jgi:predicted O-methyltransferase YrrM
MGVATLLGPRPMGFFIPYRYAATLPGPGQRAGYAGLATHFAAAEPAFAAHLAAIDALAASLSAISGPPPAPRFDQDWFPTLDAAAAYALVRQRHPRRIVEIGSGHSTRFLARAVADGGLATRITAIDPLPRAALAGLDIELRRQSLAEAGLEVFQGLAPGDMLLVDSSHVLMPGSDVDDVLNRILPLLPAGVLVHFHDVFLPDGYPEAWAWRGYNEQNALGPLLADGRWRLIFASHYVATRMAAAVAAGSVAGLPSVAAAYPASLWLEKL